MINFRELFSPEEEQFQMNRSWVPVTPEKPIQMRSRPISAEWQDNQDGGKNLKELTVPGNGYKPEMLQYNRPDQSIHLTEQTEEYNNFNRGSVERNRVINHIAGSYKPTLQFGNNDLNFTTLEFLMQNATDNASDNRSLRDSISMRTPLLPTFYPQGSSNNRDSKADGFGVNLSNNYTASDTLYADVNHLVPNSHSEFDSSNSYSLLDNEIHCTFSSLLNSSLSEIPEGGFSIPSRPDYDLNSAPVMDADDVFSFTNIFQSVPETMDQFNKCANNHLFTLQNYTTAESPSQEKDKQVNFVATTENEYQESCDGLLQHIVDSSSAAIFTPYSKNMGSQSNDCCSGSGLGPDLNTTPEQKAPKRRKHRPKVIVEGKPKRTPNRATQKKTESKENPPQKRKYVRKNVPKEAPTPQADVIETLDSTAVPKGNPPQKRKYVRRNVPKEAATPQADVIETLGSTTAIKSCKKALNFDLEKSYEDQNKRVDQQAIQHRNERDLNISSDYQVQELLRGENVRHVPTNSALIISEHDGFTVENTQPRNEDGVTLLLKERLTDKILPESQANLPLLATTEEFQIKDLSETEKGPAQENAGLCKEIYNGFLQQYMQSETYCENPQKTNIPMSQNNLHLVPNILSNSVEGSSLKREYCQTIEKQHVSATNLPDSSLLHQEIFQGEEDYNGTPMDKDLLKTRKRKKTQNRVGSQNRRTKGKKESQSQFSNEMQTTNPAGAPHMIYSTSLDEIICRFKNLNLGECNITRMDGQNAIVLYKGEGSVVPYEGFEILKKRKPRPKVDLDPETERTWKLLMGTEGSETLEGTNKQKEKWWEEEREVFRGRVSSFIARMHLVQGDRRFSRWKGSVVDSVIGVFLTQNVSDHLSSSAFMSLAARFPLKSERDRRSCHNGTNQLVEEPEVCIINQDDTIISRQPTYKQAIVPPHDTREHWTDSETSRIGRSLNEPNNQSSEEEIISSQDSLDSSITVATRGLRCSSGSNSEAEGPTTEYEPRKTQLLSSANSIQVEKTTVFEEFYNSVNGVLLFNERTKDGQLLYAEYAKQKSRLGNNDSLISHSAFNHPINFGEKEVALVPSIDYDLHDSEAHGTMKTFQMHGGESSRCETTYNHNKLQDTNYTRVSIHDEGRSVYTSTEQYGPLGYQELPTINPYEPLSMHLVHLQDNSQSGCDTNHLQPLSNHHAAGNKILQPKDMQFIESVSPQKLGRGQDDSVKDSPDIPNYIEGFQAEKRISEVIRQAYSDDITAEPQPQEQLSSSGTKYKERKLKVSKARKVKSETESKNVVDWDSLRKKVEANGEKKERSKEAMDSLDYEAVRCASVKEISEAIKERGMNNMLAERIKEFLNRLVREHGSIDLEWLRDVPPDKAKDYLLSVRGLGLKSVECVRLLTLHNLAFPVDTNVGRIAVRLGWVPLQPLPESLQLHLLELYPILESIQKYLWPRLCKLDQRTLYELHYQLITFGKVFCTKSKPNCNACPMRAECRHFASAFASARLALPGPEEKGIVSSSVPIATERNPALNMDPMLLPLPDNLLKEASFEIGKCEPIIEEPATPEQECPDTEALESDIEEFYWEDPDEIPTIKINMQQMAMNIQSYMPEGDMSKALVVLNPDTASIPTQKLKNVSRLRTEHQVYELPDSHPLLEKMDKREPDDPSPYLLAIWTPGETANSFEPPERRCISQDTNDLCNDKTCYSCNSIREANSLTVRGTILGMDMEFAKEDRIFWNLCNKHFQRPLNSRDSTVLLERYADYPQLFLNC
ncbi:Transcriptional activator DEMETER [Senna tora]|uniref:Transcriptional activator DEMETER n=1 Tax=Senna tora TaxID=362788 RepID=A0A834WF09_9FABA|nr:Transcriptional activator DEMETER [Senna tora]